MFFNALAGPAILCITLFIFARRETMHNLFHAALVVFGINVCIWLSNIGLTIALAETIPAIYITIIALALNFIIAIFLLCRFCYVSIIQASQAYISFIIIKFVLGWIFQLFA